MVGASVGADHALGSRSRVAFSRVTAMPNFKQIHNVEDLRRHAAAYLPKPVFDFIAGGAEGEAELRNNREVFDRIRFRPRTVADVAVRRIDTTLLGKPAAAPIAIAPMGGLSSFAPHAEVSMAKACAAEATGMSAVLGGDEHDVLARLDALDLIPANRNAVGQIVAAGTLTALEKLAEDPPTKARVRQLATAGAFHTHYMAPAMDGYAAAAAGIVAHNPTVTLLSNFDGRPVTSAADAMDKLIAQLTRPVRWDLCSETIRGLDPRAIVEFPPAGALTGIAKRELRGVATHAVKTPAELDALVGL